MRNADIYTMPVSVDIVVGMFFVTIMVMDLPIQMPMEKAMSCIIKEAYVYHRRVSNRYQDPVENAMKLEYLLSVKID